MADMKKTQLQAAQTGPAAEDPEGIQSGAPAGDPVDTRAGEAGQRPDSADHEADPDAPGHTIADMLYFLDPDTIEADGADHEADPDAKEPPQGVLFETVAAQEAQQQKRIERAAGGLYFYFYNDLQKKIDTAREDLEQLEELAAELKTLRPYLEEELKKPEYSGATVESLLKSIETDQIPDGHPLAKAMQEARKAAQKEPGKATITRTDKIDFPLDKVNNSVWRLLEKDTGGQIGIDFDTTRKGKQDDAHIYYAIDFENLGDEVQITRRLLPFDKRVYIAVAALFNAGNKVITLTQIYYHMGYKGTPGANDLEKIENSVIKMLGAQIIVDNKRELENAKYKYPRAKYRGPLLPVEAGELYDINGRLTNAAIHLFREPPLVSFARNRGQITTVNLSLLQSPVNKTDSNILIDDYLIERISRAKNGKRTACRILFKTLFEHCEMDSKTNADKMKRSRAPKKIERYLRHYEKDGFIKSYKMDTDRVDISL